MSSVLPIEIISKGLSNEIKWTVGNTSATDITIKKYLRNSTNSFRNNPITITPTNYALSNGIFSDYDINQNFSYRYELIVASSEKISGYCNAFNGIIDSGSVNFDYINTQFNLSWDDTSITNNKDTYSNYTYDIFIMAEPKPNSWSSNIIQFKSNSTSTTFNIKSEDTLDINGQQIKIVINTKYTFFVAPSYSFGGSGFQGPPLVNSQRTYYPDNVLTQINKSYSKTRLPPKLGTISIFPSTISNFSIKNKYNNNKISFSCDNIVNPVFSNYIITLKKNSAPLFTSSTNDNNYILDNSNFTYSPGLYLIEISANYNGLETEPSSLNFTIPITPISLTVTPLDNLGQLTNNYKNIASIRLNWIGFSYASYYKIKVRRINKDGGAESDLFFYTTNTNRTFSINAGTKVELKFSVSYSESGSAPSDDSWPYASG